MNNENLQKFAINLCERASAEMKRYGEYCKSSAAVPKTTLFSLVNPV